MRFPLLFLLLLTLCTSASAQTTVFEDGGFFYLDQSSEADNGTDKPDQTIRTKLIGDSTDYVQALRDLRRSYATNHARMIRKIYEANFRITDREFLAAASRVDVDLDSIETHRLTSQVLSERIVIRIPTEKIPAPQLPDYTDELEPKGLIRVDVDYEFNAEGKLRLRSKMSEGKWRVSIISPLQLRVYSLYGPGSGVTDFILTEQDDRRKIYREEDAIGSGDQGAFIVVFNQANRP